MPRYETAAVLVTVSDAITDSSSDRIIEFLTIDVMARFRSLLEDPPNAKGRDEKLRATAVQWNWVAYSPDARTLRAEIVVDLDKLDDEEYRELSIQHIPYALEAFILKEVQKHG